MTKLEVLTYEDGFDCEDCGIDRADGGTVLLNGVTILEYPAVAACYGGCSFSRDTIWKGINDECNLGVVPEVDEEAGWDYTFVERCIAAVTARGWELVEDHEDFDWDQFDDDDDYCHCGDEEECELCRCECDETSVCHWCKEELNNEPR